VKVSESREASRPLGRLAACALAAPSSAGYVALGAAVLLARALVAATRGGWSWLLGAGAPAGRDTGGRVREQVRAAQRAARAAGVLSPRRRK
jgi:hypothetical protein